MIFVTVGSQKFPFDRLLSRVDQMAGEGAAAEEVFMQTGCSGYSPRHCRYWPFCHQEQFAALMEQCAVLITHGGAGTMIDAIRRGKKIIAVPRLARYGEHVDDHQMELTQRFHEMGLVCACPDTARLPEALAAVRSLGSGEYPSNTEAFIASVEEFIRSI